MVQTVQSVLLKVKGSIGKMSMLVDTQALVSQWLPSMDMQTREVHGGEEELKGCGIGRP